MKVWLELEKARNEFGICRKCFKDTLEIVLSKKILKEIEDDR